MTQDNHSINHSINHPVKHYASSQKLRRQRLARRRRQVMIMRLIIIAALTLLIGLAVFLVSLIAKNNRRLESAQQAAWQKTDSLKSEQSQAGGASQDSSAAAPDSSGQTGALAAAQATEEATEGAGTSVASAIAKADLMAAGYDYDGAIDYLNALPDSAGNADIQNAIAGYQQTKSTCTAVDVTQVPHIFYHSLVNEPSIAFSAQVMGQASADGMNAWMTTVDEFDRITQQLYDNGYVYVRLRDLVVQTTDADGTVHFSPNTSLMLPPGKKAIVLSVDDLSYYHSYEAASFPDKLVLDENGEVKCHYVKPDGTESVGDYDVVPRLNTFLKEHPDGAYRGARGLIAMTGYNGVFGYRTDIDYEVKQHLMNDQAAWLEKHPDFNRQDEIEQATVIANALKDEGWEFASHTWGHLSVTHKTVDELATDNQKWVDNVQNIVGPTDTIIFAHGNDIGDWQPYSADNAKYAYFKSAGYNFFCNVDSSKPYWVQINDQNVRQGRIDLDGYMLYQASQGATETLNGLIDAASVFDSRRPTPVVANGQG